MSNHFIFEHASSFRLRFYSIMCFKESKFTNHNFCKS
nr:MAG TPA: hypothetical protein [Caudoviricetes sp.]